MGIVFQHLVGIAAAVIAAIGHEHDFLHGKASPLHAAVNVAVGCLVVDGTLINKGVDDDAGQLIDDRSQVDLL